MRVENKSNDDKVRRNLAKITFFALALVFLIFNSSILVNASSPVTFGSAINLSNDSGASTTPVVATSGSYVYTGLDRHDPWARRGVL